MQAEIGTPLSDDVGSPPRPRTRRLLAIWVSVALFAYVVDQTTKQWATHHLTVGVPRPVLGSWLTLDLTHNAGAAFSFGTGYTIALTLVALAVIIGCLRAACRLASTGWAVALGLLLSGAAGNVTDRLLRPPGPLRGHVVDFLHVPHWPVFNVADSAICVAVALFIVLNLRGVRFDGSRGSSGGESR